MGGPRGNRRPTGGARSTTRRSSAACRDLVVEREHLHADQERRAADAKRVQALLDAGGHFAVVWRDGRQVQEWIDPPAARVEQLAPGQPAAAGGAMPAEPGPTSQTEHRAPGRATTPTPALSPQAEHFVGGASPWPRRSRAGRAPGRAGRVPGAFRAMGMGRDALARAEAAQNHTRRCTQKAGAARSQEALVRSRPGTCVARE